MDLLSRLEQDHPGLEAFVRVISVYFAIPEPIMRQAYLDHLEGFPEAELRQAALQWESHGILPGLNPDRDEQTAAIWASPLFPIYALGFSPPENTDLRPFLLPPVRTPADLAGRMELPLPGVRPYWQVSLRRTFPELYLMPELTLPARGCDLACGWGRATLSLRQDLEVHGCDLTEGGLARLANLARASGRENVHTTRADVTALPYAENTFDFLLAFDIFEHLTDPTLDRALAEVLRVGRAGALLYTEVPPDSYCPPVTHLQKFSLWEIFERFRGFQAHGKTFVLARYAEEVSDQFTFRVQAV